MCFCERTTQLCGPWTGSPRTGQAAVSPFGPSRCRSVFHFLASSALLLRLEILKVNKSEPPTPPADRPSPARARWAEGWTWGAARRCPSASAEKLSFITVFSKHSLVRLAT